MLEELLKRIDNLTNGKYGEYSHSDFYDPAMRALGQCFNLLSTLDKPRWSTAPKWTNFLARDSVNHWFWYEYKPTIIGNTEWYMEFGRYERAYPHTDENSWKWSLEERPEEDDD